MTSDIFKPLSQWEAVGANNPNIEFTAFSLEKRLVIAAVGKIEVANLKHKVRWDFKGRCFYGSKRLKEFDLSL